MKQIPRIIMTCLTLLPLYMVTACSEPETHVAKINVINDLGTRAQLDLCKDDVHCDATSDLWTPTTIEAKEAHTFVVSNEQTTVFEVSFVVNGKASVRCLRVRIDKSLKTDHNNLLLSSATGC
jgi:hypothetical protein